MLPEIHTERLVIQPMDEGHFEDIFNLDSRPEVVEFIHGKVLPIQEQKTQLLWHIEEAKKHRGLGLGVFYSKEDGRFVGRGNLNHIRNKKQVHLGYRILPEEWRKGYATEVCQAFLQYGFRELNLEKIFGLTHPKNTGSQKVLEKCGLKYEGKKEAYDTVCHFYAKYNPFI